jgi:cyclophilin family peptidyl-prolyl cis-trans isomerase
LAPAAFLGGVHVAAGDASGDQIPDIVTGAGPGGGPHVEVFSGATGQILQSFFPYETGFRGGVSVAIGDVDNDGVPDIITAPGPGGGPNVKVFNGATGQLIDSFMAYDPSFSFGVSVAVGDVEGTGQPDIITGPGPGGGSTVKIFNGATGQLVRMFDAYAAGFTGGVTVAAGDVEGVGRDDIITGAGPGGGPNVKVFNGTNGQLITSFFAYDAGFTGGVNVAAGTGASGRPANIVTGAGEGGGPNVRVFSPSGTMLQSFMAYDTSFHGGVQVAAGDVNGSGANNVVTGPGEGGGPQVNMYDTSNDQVAVSFSPYEPVSVPSGGFGTSSNPLPPPPPPPANNPPTVRTPISDVNVAQNASPTVLNLSGNFADADVVGTIVHLNTSQGGIDLLLDDQQTPLTVANFLNYVNSGRYNSTIFHRSVSNFVIQGGGFGFDPNLTSFPAVQTDAPVLNEPGISNTVGTVAMAKLGNDPNSATSQFFFNLADNSSNLDNQNGGFTVFATVQGNGMQVVNALAAIPTQDRSSTNSAFTNLPLVNYPSSDMNFPKDTTAANYALINSATVTRTSDELSYSVVNNTNPGLVTTSVTGRSLTLTYTAGQTGTAAITVQATDKMGASVTTTFNVTVA